MAKPTADTKWASAATKTEPSSGEKNAGWSVGDKPPAQWLNWWMDAVDQWVVWLKDYENNAHTWSEQQTFTNGILVSGGLLDGAGEFHGSNNDPAVIGYAGTGVSGVGVRGVGADRATFGNTGVVGTGGAGTAANGIGAFGGAFEGGLGGSGGGIGGGGLLGQGGDIDGTTNTTGVAGPGASTKGGAITSDANGRKGGVGHQSEGGLGQNGAGAAYKAIKGDVEVVEGDVRQTAHGTSGINELLDTYIAGDLEVQNNLIADAAASIAGLLTASGGIALEAPIALAPLLVAPYTDFTTTSYWKNGFGEVGMRGMVAKNAATQGSTAFNLPVGYRPAVAQRFVVSSDPNLGFAYVYVQTSGAVLIQWDAAFTGYIVLDGVRFRNS